MADNLDFPALPDVETLDATPTKRAGRLTKAERDAVRALSATGAGTRQIARALGRSAESVARARSEAGNALRERARRYVDLHLAATERAAKLGRADPAQWALERIGVVEPRPAVGSDGPRVNVQIGVMLPGLGDGASQSAVTCVETADSTGSHRPVISATVAEPA